jgi:hypothetical protein
MKFLVIWTLPSGTFRAGVDRFLSTGGMPPTGVKMLGRWHGVTGRGVALAETSDAKELFVWLAEWQDVLSFEVVPCVEDAEGAEVLKGLRG